MVTVRRVVPWKRDVDVPPDEFQILLDVFSDAHPDSSVELIERAYKRSFELHSGQVRKSGEPYFLHPLAVARIVAEQGMDDVSLAAALLHDAVEDTEVGLDGIVEEFGEEVAAIIDGCTKVDRIEFDTKEQQQAATLRKMMIAVAKDVRVLIIKLADRLHNMRTIAVLPVWKQQRTATETMAVYAPLAHRLGMTSLKSQLEDLSFAAMHPKWFGEIDYLVAQQDPERELLISQVSGEMQDLLDKAGIKAQVTGRPKHLYSIYEKMVLKRREFDEIYDLVGVRIIAQDVADCYRALGAVHAARRPVQGRFKDFIAMPKFNLYQSLHTTVVGPQGTPIEVQIRTPEMHARAEFGVASHWSYKDGSGSRDEDLAWLNRIADYTADDADPGVFLTNLQSDLSKEEVLVFTPKGRIVSLEAGATPVDFAYAIHTEIGDQCIGAEVNRQRVSLDHELVPGDTVKIVTNSAADHGPSEDWLEFVTTHKARTAIRRWHLRDHREDLKASGWESLEAPLRDAGLSMGEIEASTTLDWVAGVMNFTDRDTLLSALGDGHVAPKAVVSRIEAALKGGAQQDSQDERVSRSLFQTTRESAPSTKSKGVGVHVEGLEDVWVRLSKCCRPVPPDQIMGFHTRGRGVSVHRSDCANAVSLASHKEDKLIDVEWDAAYVSSFVASIEVKAFDRHHLLAEVAGRVSDQEVNILSSSTRTGEDHVTLLKFEFELGDIAQLDSVLRSVRSVKGVYSAARSTEG